MPDLSSVRRQAWATRRKKYGPSGHAGSYSRGDSGPCPHCAGAVAMLIRLHAEGTLSEGQVAKATGLHRIEVRRLVDESGILRPGIDRAVSSPDAGPSHREGDA